MTIMAWLRGHPYPAFLALAVAVGLSLALRAGSARRFSPWRWLAVLVVALCSGLMGSLSLFLDFQPIVAGEKTILGALLLGIVGTTLASQAVGIGAWRALDDVSVPALAAMATGRIGCFIAGCCRGIETTVPWAVSSPRTGTHVHPVQLYEAAADVLLLVALTRVPMTRREGARFLAAVSGYLALRVGTEFFREGRVQVGALNTVQWALLAIGLALAVLVHLRTRAPHALHAWRSLALPRRALPFATLLLMQAPAAPPPRTELVLGAEWRDGMFDQVLGQTIETDCEGNPYDVPTLARRDTRAVDARLGVRQALPGGSRLSVEGRYIAGTDRLRRIGAGPVTTVPDSLVRIRATGLSVSTEGPIGMWSVSLLSGRFSETGVPERQLAATAAFRVGPPRGWFLSAGVADRTLFPSLGEFSYLGGGYTFRRGLRTAMGFGDGGRIEVLVPWRQSSVELSYRSLSTRSNGSGAAEMFRIGLTQAVTLRR